jgi:NAD(P)H-dependent FMN reductase
VSYGGHGGDKCAEQLKQVGNGVKMRMVPTAPGIVLSEAVIRGGAAFEPDRDFAQHVPDIEKALTELTDHVNAATIS